MTIEELWNDIHKRARHRGYKVIIDVIIQNGEPVVERHPCPCILLSQALKENNMLFGDFNEPMLMVSGCFENWNGLLNHFCFSFH